MHVINLKANYLRVNKKYRHQKANMGQLLKEFTNAKVL